MANSSPAYKRPTAPKAHRILLYFAAFVLTCLLYWLWAFLLADIGAVTLPDYERIASSYISKDLVAKSERLKADLADVEAKIVDLEQNQKLLSDSTSNARDTMNQLLENQRRLAEQKVQLSAPEQEAIAQSQKLFLENQQQYQALNQQIVEHTNQRRALKKQMEDLDKQMLPMREKAGKEYDRRVQEARMKAATIKLSMLVPLLFIGLVLVARKRRSLYGILVYPFAISVFLKTVQVVHEYFPTRYFKYIALVALILAVGALIIYVARMIARPRRDFLLRQFQEAYEKKLCPACSYPIRRGAWRDLPNGKKRGAMLVSLTGEAAAAAQEPYTCPSCGQALYHQCEACHHTRHTLLPYCEHCGAEKEVATEPPASTTPK